MYSPRFGCGSAMQQILDKDALSHVAAYVKTQTSKVMATQTDHANPGGLGLEQENKQVDCYMGDENSTTLTTGITLLRVGRTPIIVYVYLCVRYDGFVECTIPECDSTRDDQ